MIAENNIFREDNPQKSRQSVAIDICTVGYLASRDSKLQVPPRVV